MARLEARRGGGICRWGSPVGGSRGPDAGSDTCRRSSIASSLSHRHTDFDARACAQGTGAPVSEQVIPLGEKSVGRYLMIRQTGSSETWWSIAELDVACHD
ncbi:MAG: hypothetical protein K0R38_4294 [Polyangiaceae bacterium]|nr:hypothetical protein [Polyangiaceae bacterium]